MKELRERINRQELIRLAIQYAASRNSNMPAHVRRILEQKYGVTVLETEVETECALLAGETIPALSRAAQEAAKVAA